jgi:TOD1/MUCI70, glycosyltransferase-like domain
MAIIFYTALFGRHCRLKEFDTGGFKFFCFTDDPDLRSDTWTVILQPGHESPRLDAKWYKMNPDTLGLPLGNGDISIWIDASITVTDPAAMAEVCEAALLDKDIALFKHPDRTDVYAEVIASAPMPKYAGEPLLAQVVAYRADGLPDDHKLWAGGVIARVSCRQSCFSFGASWYFQCRRWSLQDQLSLPYVLWKLGIEPGVIPGSVYGTDFHTHTWTGPSDAVQGVP